MQKCKARLIYILMPLLSRSEPLCGQIWSRWYLFSEVLLEQPAAGQLAPANGHNPTVWKQQQEQQQPFWWLRSALVLTKCCWQRVDPTDFLDPTGQRQSPRTATFPKPQRVKTLLRNLPSKYAPLDQGLCGIVVVSSTAVYIRITGFFSLRF